ncbi:unnamed protein product [Adineta steineri]|uniref:Uncharacterized protein n=1 Tax=Adineta steineri TaxID=433720 RepID=A0A819M3A2_9BILA|nr:unnamed protein product [Adineta steineri]CAF3973324.1 unnamed protein product [Adineta steineri]
MAILIANQKTEYEQKINNGSNNNINIGDSALSKIHDTPVQTAFKSANTIIESGTDIIRAPAVWLKDMQKNWLSYMVVLAVILIIGTFLYCTIRSYFKRKSNNSNNNNNNNNWSMGNLVELATVFSNKNPHSQTPLSLPATKPSLSASALDASFKI